MFSGGPIKPDLLIKILDYLFPDASEENLNPYPDLNHASSNHQFSIKSCPQNGLIWRLSIVFAHCLHVLGGLKPLAHLMHEFLLEVRFRYENGILLPGLPTGNPDHGFCLFHQKLQMINCCIERKIAREKPSEEEISEEILDENSDEEDLFFDCDEEKSTEEIPIWSKEPVGRFKRLGKQKLLNHDEYIFVPICQDPTPLTEDLLAEQAEVMLQLGVDAQGNRFLLKTELNLR